MTSKRKFGAAFSGNDDTRQAFYSRRLAYYERKITELKEKRHAEARDKLPPGVRIYFDMSLEELSRRVDFNKRLHQNMLLAFEARYPDEFKQKKVLWSLEHLAPPK